MSHPMIAAAFLITLGFPLLAGQPYQALDAGDVFVATIARVEDEDATNSCPPRVWLDVHEVIRGDAKTVRSPALWSPPYHGFDFGDGNQPELKLWMARPLKGPKVGAKFILGGELLKLAPDEKDSPVYNLFDFVRIPYSDAARAKAITALAALDAARCKYAEEQAAAAKERELRGQKWRASIEEKVIDRRTQESDAVAIGTIVSGGTYQIETMLKGRPRMSTGGTYFLTLPSEDFDKRIVDLVSLRPRCVLFLSEENLIISVTDAHAKLVDPYEGIVLADDAAIAAVKASLARRPAPPPKPVLVISALNRADAALLAQAARTTFAVVQSHQFSGHGANTIIHVRETIPHAAFLVMIDRGPQRRVRAVQLKPQDALPLYDDNWPQKEAPEQFKALMTKLVEKAS